MPKYQKTISQLRWLKIRYAQWKKPDTKKHLLYDFIYIKCLEKVNPKEIKGRLVVEGGPGEKL